MNTFNDFNVFVLEKLSSWVEGFAKMLPNLFLAALVVFIFYSLAKYSQNPLINLFSRVSDNTAIVNLFSKATFVFIFSFGIFAALSILKLEKAVTSLLAGAGVIGLALGFAFQEIVSNFVAGILLSIQKPYRVGDVVRIGDYFGKVDRIDLRVTIIRTFQGLEVLVPNKEMYTSSLINYTLTPYRRIDFNMGISYGEDLGKVEKVVKGALTDFIGRAPDKDIEVFFHEFGDSSINFLLQVWIEYPGENYYWKAHHQIVTKIKSAFDSNDITIPFPIRTLDFGIKGGKTLSQELPRLN